jgi:ABC-type Fe3+-hydroxamate transport system substrate-binding protein
MLTLFSKKPVLHWLFLLSFYITLLSCDTQTTNEVANDKIKLIALSPHLAELVVSAGALENLVGVVSYSDFPSEITTIQKIGDAFKLDFETIVSLKPDYVLTWKGGTPIAMLEKLKSLNLTIIETEINTLEDIAKTIIQIAELTHTQDQAQKATTAYIQKLTKIKKQKQKQQTAFIETYHQPLYTVSGKHWMSQAISLCGYENIFNDLSQQSATVTLESVILKKPQAIINIAKQEDQQWQKWQNLDAVKNNNIILINPDYFSRPSLRILQGIEELCAKNN